MKNLNKFNNLLECQVLGLTNKKKKWKRKKEKGKIKSKSEYYFNKIIL